MNNFYVLIYLTRELKARYTPFIFSKSLSPNKNIWEAEILVHDKKKRLTFSSHPSDTALFPDQYRPHKKKNVTFFFEPAEEQIVRDIRLADNDRIISFHFTNQTRIVFHLFGNHPNIFFVRNGIIEEAFKSPSTYRGRELPPPRKAAKQKPLSSTMSARQAILATDPAFPRHLIQPVIKHYHLSEKSPEACREVTLKLQKAMLHDAEFRVLDDGNICLIPATLLPEPDLKVFDSIGEAIRFAFYRTSGQRRLAARKNRVEPALEKARKKLERTITRLSQADKALQRSETYEQFGHLLMAHAHEKISPGTKEITLDNFYDGNRPVRIPLQANKSLAENASYYYQKSSDAITRAEESEKRLITARKQLKLIKNLIASFQKIERVYEFDSWMNEHEETLQKSGVLTSDKQQTPQPFGKVMTGGYEIWIGKNAKSNDKLTTMAHKEDIWLHARGVSGSHVVIRMNNNKEMPPRHVLLKAASYAAWNSKARGSSLVPVIITKRKYVIKPKGAPAGTVRVQKEDVEMVQPQAYKPEK